MQFSLVYIRFKQLQRAGKGLGLYAIVFVALAAYLIVLAYKQFTKGQNAWAVMAACTALCLVLQFYRRDKAFVYKHLPDPQQQIFFEYAVLTLPFTIASLFTKSWYYYPALLVILYCVPLFQFKFKQRTTLKNLSNIIPAENFEWLSGFRKQFIAIISLYVLAIAFCWLRILPLVLLWFLTISITSFYTECEPIQILREKNKLPSRLVLDKLMTNIWYIIIFYTPVIIVNTIFNTELLWLNILFIPMQLSIVCFAICLKYSSYQPNERQVGNSIPLAIISISSALPYLLPVPALLSIVYYQKAKRHLKQYLND